MEHGGLGHVFPIQEGFNPTFSSAVSRLVFSASFDMDFFLSRTYLTIK